MSVNRIGLFVNTPWRIKFTTLDCIPSCTNGKLGNFPRKVTNLYNASSFKVITKMMYREFNCLIPDFPEVKINSTSTSEPILEIGRKFRAIKERECSIWTKLKLEILPKRIITAIMKFVVMWFNAFPVKSGVSATYRSQTIMNGTTLDRTKHCKSEFVVYCEVHN